MAEDLEKEPQNASEPATKGPIATDRDEEKSETSSFKQDGVKHVEAITSVWTTKSLWITFVL